MSSRALRKAQREREEQEQLQRLQQDEAEEEEKDGEDDAPAVSTKVSAFAMLDEDDEEAEDDDGGAALDATEEPTATTAAVPQKSAKKKRKKKGKGKVGQGQADPQDDGLDEIGKALKQLATNGASAPSGTTSAGVNEAANETNRLLAIDTSHLHAQNEMRRLFGRAALEQQDDDEAPAANQAAGGNRRQQRHAQQMGLAHALRGQGNAGGRSGGLAAMALRRNIFIQGKEEWPIATGGGLGMEVEENRSDGTVLYRFVHNRMYQDVQSQFEMCVESMDPNHLVQLLQHNPYHISTLLQVSEIAKQERDHSTSGDLLERALFSFGRAVHSTFAKNLGEGKARLDFRRPENREFWLASWRYMQNLSMRGTWRTVYEWTKLLLSLSPEDDPYALWLVLDQYALRSRQDLDYLNVSRNATFRAVHKDMPNVQLSQGLAEYKGGNKGKGKQALFTAVGRFPWVVARLMHELNLDPAPAIWGKEPRTEKEKLHSELYASRAKDVWNTPENIAFLVEVAAALPPDTPPAPINKDEITSNEARHVLLSDTPALIALLPRHFTARLTSASDPLSPDDSLASYTTTRSRTTDISPRQPNGGLSDAAESLRELQGLHGWFANLFPWFRPTDGGNDAGDEAHHRPSEEEIESRIREAGVSEDTIVERTQRMMMLQQRLMGGGGPGEGEELDLAAFGPGLRQRGVIGEAPDSEVEQGVRARVEDADEDEEG
ncbi:hypothetical protein LTS02_005975 [Friedmanniomyces endolithicus]|nr:hypothetical protein LTR94_001797 [Friedmanniomyces endolithicus]KAK0797557.1 hypothetical protein LTR59_006762 [Friedmanniomyces endolithicus]KAK0817142.1 hypothetical protein LTR38_001778 [Friedmanniomyces endolithicus]KAK0819937.1 hypothetical protein LTR75_001965 [Friedmanniomyces endolithicus]KAK0852863.1 hypothetical protein LTR03_003297 [Friedmanniomyces endolithicus]